MKLRRQINDTDVHPFVCCLAGKIIIPTANLATSLGLKVQPGEQSRIRTDMLLLELAI